MVVFLVVRRTADGAGAGVLRPGPPPLDRSPRRSHLVGKLGDGTSELPGPIRSVHQIASGGGDLATRREIFPGRPLRRPSRVPRRGESRRTAEARDTAGPFG